MFYNYIKVAIRNIQRNKYFHSINILGLALALSIALLIIVLIHHEVSYDRFIGQNENIYRVYRNWSKSNERIVWTPSRLAEKLITDFPEVKASTGLSPGREQLIEYKSQKFYVDQTASVDSTFFQTIPLPFKYGNINFALKQPNSVVISSRFSKKIFGNNNPLGEVLEVNDVEHKVTGVVDLDKKQTHLDYEIFTRFSWYSNSWVSNNRATYVRLDPRTNLPDLEKKITEYVNKLSRQELIAGNVNPNEDEFAEWKLQPLLDIYLYSSGYSWMANKRGDIRSIYIFALIAILILIVAIFNYINLATAMAAKRAKEIGVRKVTGAIRSQLLVQFMTESLLQVFLAGLLALLLSQVFLPFFNSITDRELLLVGGKTLWVLGPFIGITLLIGFLSGIYPALILSGIKPLATMQSYSFKLRNKIGFRKMLVIGQFSITISFLLIMTFIFRQVSFMMQHELGFKPAQVIDIPLNSNKSHYKVESLKPVINAIPGVQSVSSASSLPGQSLPDWGMIIEGETESISPNIVFADEDYFRTLGIELVQGRFLSDKNASDSVDNFVVNETFVNQYNLKNPLGTKLRFTNQNTFGQIVGVIKDFHFRGLQYRINPLVINGNHRRSHVAIQLNLDNLQSSILELSKIWTQVEPDHLMRHTFLDDDFAMQYASQKRLGDTMLYSSLFTLLIAILGLYGLTMFTVERRKKEIGIRKVLGASTISIVGLLSKDFIQLVLIAMGIALPVGWFFTNKWLENFAFRTEIVWWVFLVVGLSILSFALASISMQAIKAALINPVNSLKEE